jgi:hypothetical protein
MRGDEGERGSDAARKVGVDTGTGVATAVDNMGEVA